MEESTSWQDEYRNLIISILWAGEATKERPAGDDNRLLAAEGLLFKVFDLACTALNLFESGTKCADIASYYHPVSALNVIARAAYETFLIFDYVFIAQQSNSKKDLRYWLWKRSSLLDWRDQAAQSSVAHQELPQIEAGIAYAEKCINLNQFYATFGAKKQKHLLKRNKWKPEIKEMAKQAGIGPLYRDYYYRYLCGYVHSSYQSIVQIQEANNNQERQRLLMASVRFIMLSMAIFVKKYLEMWGINHDQMPEHLRAAVIIWSGVAMDKSESTKDILSA